MLFANGQTMRRINFDGTDFKQIFYSYPYRVLSCDFDFSTSYVYFATLVVGGAPFIGRIPLTGGAMAKIVTSGVGYVENLEVDYLHRKLIWIDSRYSDLGRIAVLYCTKTNNLRTLPRFWIDLLLTKR